MRLCMLPDALHKNWPCTCNKQNFEDKTLYLLASLHALCAATVLPVPGRDLVFIRSAISANFGSLIVPFRQIEQVCCFCQFYN